MIMEKKTNKGIVVLIIGLILCIIGLVFYILVDKDIIKLNNATVENEQVEKNNTNDDTEEKDTEVELDPENANIKSLFDNAHFLSIGVNTYLYQGGGYKVSDMSMEEKMTLLARQWTNLLVKEGPYSSDSPDYLLYLDESTLKEVFESTFGPDTYETVDEISDNVCYTLTYDAANKRYSYYGNGGCGGTSAFSVHEKIISATKYSDRIEIVSAAFYIDGESQQIYKDYNKTTSLGKDIFYTSNYTDDEREKLKDQYIDENKDNLEQYTYTYTLNEDGFYYLTSVERTKA